MATLSTYYPAPITAADLGLGPASNATFGSIQNTPIGNTTPNTGAFTTLSGTAGGSNVPLAAIDSDGTSNGSNVFECFRGAARFFSIRDDGSVFVTGSVGEYNVDNYIKIQNNVGVKMASSSRLWWTPTNTNSNTISVQLLRDGADNTIAQVNSTNPQTFRLYNTFTSATNFERLAIGWSGNVVSIKPEAGGSGGTVRELHISGLPTANPGPGILWNNAGTVEVGT